MSFSSEIKKKLCEAPYVCGACSAAELTGFTDFSGGTASGVFRITTESAEVCARLCAVMTELFGDCFSKTENGRGYRIAAQDTRIVKLLSECSRDIEDAAECCRAAYVRGAFLCGGSVSNPSKSYQMEFNAGYDGAAYILQSVLRGFGIESRTTQRKGRRVVYMKECDAVADTLTLMGAGSSVMELYNIQIEKDLRNSINRQVNCEAANTGKTVKAASRHIRAIRKIQKHMGLERLPDVLYEIARLRLEYPEESLKELGGRTCPPIGKSGVNHRLERIVKIAEDIV